MTHKKNVLIVTLLIFSVVLFASITFETHYRGKAYPGVSINGKLFEGKTRQEIISYWQNQNEPFQKAVFELRFENEVASLSGSLLDVGYDATLSATQSYLVGRSGYFFSDLFHKYLQPTNLSLSFRWNSNVLDETLELLEDDINIPVSDALFQFNQGRVTMFRPSREGRSLNIDETKKQFEKILSTVPQTKDHIFSVPLVVDTIAPSITTDEVNDFGIKELIGQGYSTFAGSIAGRVHNIVLAASRINGVLIKPGEVFSFNDTVGDISAATGYQSAYIIKDGRTVLGDGGGVCQVSTTLFRAALAAGLPVIERYAHAYRVHFYEDGGFKPGLDATVYSPNYDLKFTNNTNNYILIQAKTDTRKQTLTFELYGTGDGRTAQILNHKVWDITPAPPDLYQDDPTLAPGEVKQVDWAAKGAKASFDYLVTKNGETLTKKTFFSNFRPWQAVYLRGPVQQ
ncbi:hypothetical protein A3A79_03555 [Candidatus Gottesmanbacteria bacterium RIFCSPLOWO2_01_FULL_43_11b]|uniref:YoaR-like putative peptidoglycan binding domain-containing protein n=1 Tax=Candidatus Gottesmanbacteria bacterium RIFCSPLOWO2_01_FULL_43_11b TaxID=1798392 RepID=A0A1F6AIY6_9BACT|nr:MAG: hypothetical protein A3A79_03555 [Candidatus Gottesmanbacteria bacterium RIFCSPLOWO2_01_FULL_43_11b]